MYAGSAGPEASCLERELYELSRDADLKAVANDIADYTGTVFELSLDYGHSPAEIEALAWQAGSLRIDVDPDGDRHSELRLPRDAVRHALIG